MARPTWTKKTYDTVASALRKQHVHATSVSARLAIEAVASTLADDFQADNGSFDRTQFLAAAKGW